MAKWQVSNAFAIENRRVELIITVFMSLLSSLNCLFKVTKPTIALLIAAIGLLASCSSVPETVTKYQPKYQFDTIKSYSMYERNSSFTELQNLADGTRNQIELALERALDSRGLQYKPFKEADIIVSYYLVGRNNVEFRKYNKGIRYCATCLRFAKDDDDDHQRMSAKQASRGSLIVDLVDPKNKRTMWRSSAKVDIEAEDSSPERHDKISQAVKAMLSAAPLNR